MASHFPRVHLKSVSVADRDTGLISTDAKDLKVSLRISHRSQTTAEEQTQEKREGRGGRDGERQRMGFETGGGVFTERLITGPTKS